jgi:hypothetical protein
MTATWDPTPDAKAMLRLGVKVEKEEVLDDLLANLANLRRQCGDRQTRTSDARGHVVETPARPQDGAQAQLANLLVRAVCVSLVVAGGRSPSDRAPRSGRNLVANDRPLALTSTGSAPWQGC